MTRAYFTKKARHDIWAEGKSVKKVHESGKYKGSEYTTTDKSKPSGKDDRLIVRKGESYYWWKFAFGPKRYSKSMPTRSQLTQSSFLADLYDLEDDINSATASNTDDLNSLRDEWVERIESMRDQCQDNRDNMPEQLQEVGSGEILGERIDALDAWIDDLNGVDCDVSDVDMSEVEADNPRDEGESDDDYQMRLQEAADEKYDEDVQSVLEELQNCSSNL